MGATRQHSEESAAKAPAREAGGSASREQAAAGGSPNALFRLHRTHGNRFVQRMVRAGVFQAKLRISEPGDQYEQEADRVAERVMRMPARGRPEEEEEAYSHAQGGQVQRACTACEDERKVQRLAAEPGLIQRQAEEEEVSLERLDAPLAVRAKHLPGEGGGAGSAITAQSPSTLARAESHGAEQSDPVPRSDSLDEGALQSGGQPLPTPVRTFYEDRFGRDFGDVRVHTGAESARANDDVSAYAFTYGNHVWLGRDQRVEPSFLLAHELAHVVQQKQPPLMRSARAGSTPRDRDGGDTMQSEAASGDLRIQRFVPYWEPYDMDGTATHALVLPEMGKQNNIFTEAPVPNADKTGDGYGKRGIADLYDASTTVGLFFIQHQNPAPLPSDRKLMKGGAKFPHSTSAAPQVKKGASRITRVNEAPKEIKLGDLKPTHLTIEALLGTEQLGNYIKGFKLAQGEVDETPTAQPAGAKWGPISARTFTSTELTVPAEFVYPGTKQTSRKVVLKQGSRPVDPRQRPVMGKLFVAPDPTRGGIWNYFWFPDKALTVADLPVKVRNLGPEIERRIINPLMNSPIQKAPKAKPGPAPGAPRRRGPAAAEVARPDISHSPSPVLRRKVEAPARDNFDFTEWKKSHDAITKDFGVESKTSEFREAELSLLSARAQEHEKQKTGVPLPEVSSAAKEGSKALGKIEFWTGASSLPFGYLRRIFGTAFVKVAQLYVRVREKFGELLKRKKRTGGQSGLLGSALNAAFAVIKLAGSYVIQKTVDRLLESLATGVTEKVKALFNFDGVTAVEEKLAEIKKLQDDLEKRAVDTVDGLLAKTVGPYIEKLKEIEEVQRAVSDILQIVNLVRWGARVIACLSPPGWGCLWILAESVIEELAARAVETCWFKRKITPLINSVRFVADLPKDLADLIIGKLREFLPGPLHDVFATLDRSSVAVRGDDIECEEDEGRDALTPERQELLNMQERLGEEKFQAFAELSQKSGIPRDKPLTVAEIKKITETIQSSGVTADQMKEYAANYPAAPGGMPVDIATFLDGVKGGAPAPAGGTPSTAPPATTPAPADEKDTPPSSSDSGGVTVADAKDRPFEQTPTGKVPDAVARVVNQSWSHTRGTTPDIDVMGFWKGKAVILIKYIKTEVSGRNWFPKGSDEGSASHLIISYKLRQGVDFNPIPGGLPKDETIKAALEVKKG
jgi:hypothetical protein